jgi:hypothetical protein
MINPMISEREIVCVSTMFPTDVTVSKSTYLAHKSNFTITIELYTQSNMNHALLFRSSKHNLRHRLLLLQIDLLLATSTDKEMHLITVLASAGIMRGMYNMKNSSLEMIRM